MKTVTFLYYKLKSCANIINKVQVLKVKFDVYMYMLRYMYINLLGVQSQHWPSSVDLQKAVDLFAKIDC